MTDKDTLKNNEIKVKNFVRKHRDTINRAMILTGFTASIAVLSFVVYAAGMKTGMVGTLQVMDTEILNKMSPDSRGEFFKVAEQAGLYKA